jgi:hypothetical protein
MEYVAILRARRVLTWYGSILFALVALGLALAFKDGPPNIHSGGGSPKLYLESILAGAAFGPLFLAAFLSGGLDAEYKTAAIAWTRPIARLNLAARYLGIDAAALLAAWLITLLAALIPILVLGVGKYITVGADANNGLSWNYTVLAFGCAVMWYGSIVLIAAVLPGHAARIVGASWAYALIVPGLAAIPFPAPLHLIVVALNFLNPLAYLSHHSNDSSVQISSGPTIPGTISEHALVAWTIGIVAIAIGTQIWARREVPA